MRVVKGGLYLGAIHWPSCNRKAPQGLLCQHIDVMPPFIHDLVRLAEKAGISLTEAQKDAFDTISTFNLRSRYDDYKREFHRKCNRAFTEMWIAEIKELRTWIKNAHLMLS